MLIPGTLLEYSIGVPGLGACLLPGAKYNVKVCTFLHYLLRYLPPIYSATPACSTSTFAAGVFQYFRPVV